MTGTNQTSDTDLAPIFHIARPDELAEAKRQGVLAHPSLASEGFIHCSFANQILRTVAKHFDDPRGLLLLEVDRKLLKRKVVVEDSYGSGLAFPHIYGPLKLSAVAAIHELVIDAEGRVSLPAPLKAL